jgi:uncharacterized membrane protein (DUF373 family)
MASETGDWRARWRTFSMYEKFEQLIGGVIILVIAAIVAIATWQLVLYTIKLAGSHLPNPADPQLFQTLFGMVLTVLIALEFKHTLMAVRRHHGDIIQMRAVVLIALLALVRRFIIMDLYQTAPSIIAALAGATLALGIVFWLVSDREKHYEEDCSE